MAFQIVTDSCCDFTDAEYRAMDVACVPLSVMWDGRCYDHFSNESALKDFYQQMRNGLVATTSALNPDNWAKTMEPFLKEGKDLLVIAVSSGISTTYQSAMIAAADLREAYPQRVIQVVDSLSGSLGEGLLLWHTCRMRDAGESLSNVAAWLREHCRRICHWVTVNDLSNLKRSGRLSSAGAFVGTMLDIKPIIKVTEEGKLVSDAKVRGRRASIRMLAQKFAEYRSASEEDLVTIAHGDCPEDAEALAAILKNEYGTMMQAFLLQSMAFVDASYDYLVMLMADGEGKIIPNALKFPKRAFQCIRAELNGEDFEYIEDFTSPFPVEVTSDMLECFEGEFALQEQNPNKEWLGKIGDIGEELWVYSKTRELLSDESDRKYLNDSLTVVRMRIDDMLGLLASLPDSEIESLIRELCSEAYSGDVFDDEKYNELIDCIQVMSTSKG